MKRSSLSCVSFVGVCCLVTIFTLIGRADAFAPIGIFPARTTATTPTKGLQFFGVPKRAPLQAQNDNGETTALSDSDQTLLGAAGTVGALITLYSEFVLKTTGCGLPAGPLGLVGAAEGVSYLGVVGLSAFSLYKKVKTGSGLPAGPAGLLGAAEGLSYLAIAAGLVVLGFQVMNYGYIPNAVPMEGGMCS